MTVYGQPYLLEDKTGKLSGSEFIDIHDRLHFTYRCTARASSHATYMIFNSSNPLIALTFGPKNALGTVSLSSNLTMPMNKYLVKVSTAYGRSWKFVASDRQEYFWKRRSQENQEWTCTNAVGYVIASYSLKTPGEPVYETSSGCSLTVEEDFGHLAAEMLGSLMILRHIVEYGL
ncbi:hypothetical protein Moror_9774 [Moniliophthora roreri MCA 2997]|uniref:Uncharacterized protein n=1 Tax=Moniliophthora roreri (strain MCA 2997) TaxID=1381753 RepID=V2X1C8_MONRO|nr:hypothetical protein Moror_9774 [Moniliophthora roreri MCA 2997]KAI3599186.1 hypothetical protein WG66_013440 [Moniliophthora roreri]